MARRWSNKSGTTTNIGDGPPGGDLMLAMAAAKMCLSAAVEPGKSQPAWLLRKRARCMPTPGANPHADPAPSRLADPQTRNCRNSDCCICLQCAEVRSPRSACRHRPGHCLDNPALGFDHLAEAQIRQPGEMHGSSSSRRELTVITVG